MKEVIRAVRGMNDLLPDQSDRWARVEQCLARLAQQSGYREIRFPIVEATALFTRGIGEVTDIVEKEMYTFPDRNGDSLTLRPEGTAPCVRAGIEHGLLYNQVQRLFYYGPMFRHERPQRGRYRQFHQFGVEAYGLTGPDIDVELMQLAARFWRELGIDQQVTLQINNLGDELTRANYREQLVTYFNRYPADLDEDSHRRLATNPLRILDSKNPVMQQLTQGAPRLADYLSEPARRHFERLQDLLTQLGLPYEVNHRLVRGLDYYNLTVFEWVELANATASQNTVCAGGHYDGLVATLGGKSTPAIGFALGMERLLSLVAQTWRNSTLPKIYLIVLGDEQLVPGLQLAEQIRQNCNLQVTVNSGHELKAQLKRADKSGADIALICGATELANQTVAVKYLRENRPQFLAQVTEVAQPKFWGCPPSM